MNDEPSTMNNKQLEKTIPSLRRILTRFLPQIRDRGWSIVGSFIALLAETVFRLMEPWPIKYMFDNIIVNGFQTTPIGIPFIDRFGAMGLLTFLAVILVVLVALRGVAAYLSTYGMALAASGVLTEVRSQLYSHIQRLSLAFHYQNKSGDLITRVTSDIERLQEVTVMALLPLLANLLTMAGMIGVMFWINLELGLIAMTIAPLFILSSTKMTKRIRIAARSSRKREGAMAATLSEALGAIKVVQALSLQGMLEQTFYRNNQKSLSESAQAQRLKAGLERTVEILVGLVTAIVLWRGVQLVLLKVITPGDLIIFINYLKLAFKPMRQVAKYIGQIAKATASGERILDLMEIVPEIKDLKGAIAAPPFRGRVQFCNVFFAYDRDTYNPEKAILKNVSFDVGAGRRVALVGASGGGKSTLVSLLLRFYDPLEGQILIDGHDLREYQIDSLRKQISIVLQDSVLFAASIRDNIAYGYLSATDAEIEQAARLANAHDFISKLPQGYETVVGERGATLSGGQRQRIAIARAAVRKAPIVILDEPTVGLDNKSERQVSEALERLTQNSTTFLITHDLKTAKTADRIFYIEAGKIWEAGTHEQLMRYGGCYAALYQLQTTVGERLSCI
jgi:ATP-binding cassette subfamily B protein